MEEQLLKQIGAMVEILKNGFDVVIKKTKDNDIKLMYCRPKNWKETDNKGVFYAKGTDSL